MAGKRTGLGREYDPLRTMLRFYCRHFFGNFFICLLPANYLPLTAPARSCAFHRFNNTMRVVDQANTAASARADTRPLLRRIRVSLNKNRLIIYYLSLNWAAKRTHFAQTWRQGCFPFYVLGRIPRQCAWWKTAYRTG